MSRAIQSQLLKISNGRSPNYSNELWEEISKSIHDKTVSDIVKNSLKQSINARKSFQSFIIDQVNKENKNIDNILDDNKQLFKIWSISTFGTTTNYQIEARKHFRQLLVQ